MENKELKYYQDIEELKSKLDNGEANPLLILGQIKKQELILAELREYTMEFALNELDNYVEKTVDFGGYEFSKSSGGSYSYKHCKEWLSINDSKRELEKKMQNAYKSQMNEQIDAETGEIIYSAEYISSKESIKINIKR